MTYLKPFRLHYFLLFFFPSGRRIPHLATLPDDSKENFQPAGQVKEERRREIFQKSTFFFAPDR